jgi:lipopolysaccharide export system protein LptA
MTFRARFAAVALVLGLLHPALAPAQGFRLGEGVETRDAPLEIISDQLEVDQNTGTTIFTGNVQATRGNVVLTSQELHVFTIEDDEGRNQIVQVRALRDAVLVTPTESAQADQMDYFVRTEMVEAFGNVILVQGPNTLTGPEAVLNLATGEGRIMGGVRTILQVD